VTAGSLGEHLRAIAGDRVQRDAPLAPLTTFRVGGPADWLVDVRAPGELSAVVAAAEAEGVSITILGGGSNVLIADAGLRGVVVRMRLTRIEQMSETSVRAEAGVTMNGLVRWTIARGIGGIEAWAGTPGTVGGAVYGNAHYGGRNIGELITRVTLLSQQGSGPDWRKPRGQQGSGPDWRKPGLTPSTGVTAIDAADMDFGYDTSRLQRTREILVSAEFRVHRADPESLRVTARQSLAHRKRTQPLALPSAGCVFQNPDPARDRLPDGVPASAGALIDRAGLKGYRIGGARISPAHANFIVNEGQATARDIRALVDEARRAVRARFGIELRDEVVYLGEF
jgi:UDP-N-acetylmuramate dehydrogenase